MEILIAALPILGFVPCSQVACLFRSLTAIGRSKRRAVVCEAVHTAEGTSHA